MHTSRPVFLNLWHIKLPLPGLVSILHRISGVLMVLSIPVAAILFHQALSGPEGFAATAAFLDSWLIQLPLLLLTWSLLHHLLAGIRHLGLDIGVGLDRPVARKTAWVVLIGAPVLLVVVLALGG
ncbi:succinate dehydrogenase, cytochrome b556 subunit [Thiorhodococcus mannitoliphagus]|uniref:Succinate dehydrogenase cytochrome b556 subunit n=1 Tax=Thiorhodococcus mannitoliphagus TaxID=329406 RepID=A0A6P1DVV8_9GAMM|nr:succinate dehydrogenase, cytochrome b556 subunit [Thiorhodococcus mannitoliphagus]NEX19814.1 succinate dehydrogenase, cytochrome b556 subunit [Thiorhodococcus mannitoliphagus]